MQRLLADIEAGKVDCVVVYKVDRLSRSLLDFARIMETFERHHVSFVCVTQQFNTATSMGRLMLNVLLSFAQFEREMITERTRDKIAATRRKGKWSGGMPMLGYDVVGQTKLVVDEAEASRVRQIFELYLEHEVAAGRRPGTERRGWRPSDGPPGRGRRGAAGRSTRTACTSCSPTSRTSARSGTRTKSTTGSTTASSETELCDGCRRCSSATAAAGGAPSGTSTGPCSRGCLRCAACDCAMSPAIHARGQQAVSLLRLHAAQKRGWHKCPSPSIPAGEIERFVVDQIKASAGIRP